MSACETLLIYGAGHLGRQVLTHLISHYPQMRVAGFIDDTMDPGTPVVHGFESVGGLEQATFSESHGPGQAAVVFAIGYADMPARRRALDLVAEKGFDFFSVIHPAAIVDSTATIESGCTVLAGAIIDQGATLEVGSYVDIGVRIGEDAVLGRCSYASSGASLGGNVQVGENCFLGMDCTVTTGVSVRRHCFINAKSW